MQKIHNWSVTVLGLLLFSAPNLLLADPRPANYFAVTPNKFPQFAEANEKSPHRFDFSQWQETVQALVVDFGAPDRVGVEHPSAITGSRFIHGHTSKYRLEANRIPFSYIDEKGKAVLTQLREDLESIGNQVPLGKLSRKSQMAYWMNLHNALVIEQLALHYPTIYPEKARVGQNQLPLHEAKLTKIQGVELSLQDIRREIVYRNWRNPNAIYGFYLGTVGGPSIQNTAYTESNIDRLLKKGAELFVNSLRGVAKTNTHITLSTIYADSKPLFPAWPVDLLSHLSQHSGDVVSATLATSLPIKVQTYDPKIADFAGGRPVRAAPRPRGEVLAARAPGFQVGGPQSGLVSLRAIGSGAGQQVDLRFFETLLRERNEKYARLRRRELRDLRFKGRKNTVIVEEIEPTDEN